MGFKRLTAMGVVSVCAAVAVVLPAFSASAEVLPPACAITVTPSTVVVGQAATVSVSYSNLADAYRPMYWVGASFNGGNSGPFLPQIQGDGTASTSLIASDVIIDVTDNASNTGIVNLGVYGAIGSNWAATLLCSATITAEKPHFVTRGYFAPVDNGDVVNVVKGGSTVPLKYSVLTSDGQYVTDLSVRQSFTTREYVCSAGAPTDDVETVTAGGTMLSYNAGAQQFVQAWQTPKAPGTCLQAITTLSDGTKIKALFRIR